MADSHRTARVGERLRAELARLLTQEFSDPRLASLTVTRAEVTSDLQLATVGVRLLPDPQRDERAEALARKQALTGLKSASGRLRTLLAPALGLRRAIELRFVYDEGIDAQSKIEMLLDEISRDTKKS
jgi:ribosome-binding factor A